MPIFPNSQLLALVETFRFRNSLPKQYRKIHMSDILHKLYACMCTWTSGLHGNRQGACLETGTILAILLQCCAQRKQSRMPRYFIVQDVYHLQYKRPHLVSWVTSVLAAAIVDWNVCYLLNFCHGIQLMSFQGRIQDFYSGVSTSEKLQEYIWN